MKSIINLRLTAGRALWGAGIAAALLAISGVNALGQAFTPGNLIVLQQGDGIQNIGYSNRLVLDQFTPSGTLVNQILIPTNGPSSLLQEGNQDVEGFINLTPNGQDMVFVGYNVPFGFPGNFGSTVPSASAPRAVATVDVNGNYSLVTNTTVFFNTYNIRAAASDGNFNYWAVGSGDSPSEGIKYMGAGMQAGLTPGTVLNDRDIQIIGGNLYYSTGSGSRGIIEISGEPMAGSPTLSNPTNYVIPTGAHFGTESSPTAFVFNPAMTVCYVADLNTYTNAAGVGGIEKWTNNAGIWTFAYDLQPGPAGNTNGAVAIAVNFGATTNIYGTLNNTATNIFALTDTGPASVSSIIYTAPATNIALRGICFAPTNSTTPAAAVISGVYPASQTANVGSTVAFTAVANVGAPAASNLWYFVSNSATYFIPGATGTTLTLTNVPVTASGGYYVVLSNATYSVTSSVVSLTVIAVPTITGISPSSVTANAGQTVTYTLSGTTGVPPASNFWYQISGTAPHMTTNLVATTYDLTLSNVLATNDGSYYAVLTNSSGSATSTLATLTVIDPIIQVEPSSVQGLVDGTVQFSVTVAGTAPVSYQWYLSDTNGDLIAPAAGLGDGSTVSGANSSVLTFANLQPNDLTNFVVVVTNIYGAVTSSVASVLGGSSLPESLNTSPTLLNNSAVLALWDFDGPAFTNFIVNPTCVYDPAPFVGNGTSQPVGTTYNPAPVLNLANLTSTSTSPFATGANDPNDVGFDADSGGYVFTPYGFEQPAPNGSLGLANFPAVTGTNKQNGFQFNVSTVGAKNIRVSYDARVSATASEYFRLQYTTNGTTWIDYPVSCSFDGNYGSGDSGYYTFSNNLVGYPGVDNNPNFGFRLVTEWQSTATYQTAGSAASDTNDLGANGMVATNFWVGTANSYVSGASGNAAAGTFSLDLVAVVADAMTNNNTPPAIGSFAAMPVTNSLAFTNMVDTSTLLVNFTASSPQMAASELTFTAQPLGTLSAAQYNQTVNPNLTVVNTSSTNFQLSISFSGGIPDAVDATPILVTATDTNGESASSWFLLTVFSQNQPPTNTLTAVHGTNMLVNGTVTIPFVALGVTDGTTNLSFNINSDNNTVIPDGNIVIGGGAGGNYTLTITPTANQVGNALVTVTAVDSNPSETRSTTANIAINVLPNNNDVAVDYFNYDSAGSLDIVAADYWKHLSGNNGQLQVSGSGGYPADVATLSAANTENLEAQLLNSPYTTNSPAVLYSAFTVNIATTANLPTGNGQYIAAFNDGSGNTANVEDCLVVATNGAAAGNYRLGIASGISNPGGATGLTAQMFPQDLVLGSNYLVITKLTVANGYSTLWVGPTNLDSLSVTDTTAPATPTNLYDIVNFELRENGGSEGVVNLGNFVAGVSFNSVFYPAQANPAAYTVTENTTNVLSPLTNCAGWSLSLVSVTGDGNETVSITGTNITFIPNSGFTGTAVVGYTIQDNLGNQSSSTVTVTVTSSVVTPIPLAAQLFGSNLVMSWTNPAGGALSAFSLQYSTNVVGPYVTIPGATSPYTNLISTNAAGFFRLVH